MDRFDLFFVQLSPEDDKSFIASKNLVLWLHNWSPILIVYIRKKTMGVSRAFDLLVPLHFFSQLQRPLYLVLSVVNR